MNSQPTLSLGNKLGSVASVASVALRVYNET
jgi:hypothetical protein